MAGEAKRAGGGGESAKAVSGGKTAGLAGLTEELTLDILFRLDFKSLAATKRVCRRLSRIAHDPALFRRVSLIQLDQSGGAPVLRTNCAQLGAVRMWRLGRDLDRIDEEDEVWARFHCTLSRLVKGGAALSALDFSHPQDNDMHSFYVCEILAKLPALLKKLRVKLRHLEVMEATPEQLLELVQSQPSLEVLNVRYFPPDAVELVRSAPNLRHLTLDDGAGSLDPGLLRGVVPQLRSLSFHCIWSMLAEDWILPKLLSVLREAGEGRLRLRSVGSVLAEPEGDVDCAVGVVFAVEDFRMEELRSAPHICGPAEQRMPKPSLDDDEVAAFLRHVDQQQQKEAKKEKEAKEAQVKNKAQEA